jgi:hypothetical protein
MFADDKEYADRNTWANNLTQYVDGGVVVVVAVFSNASRFRGTPGHKNGHSQICGRTV